MGTAITISRGWNSNHLADGSSVTLNENFGYRPNYVANYQRPDISLFKYDQLSLLDSKYFFSSDNLKPFLLSNYILVPFLFETWMILNKILPHSILVLEVKSDDELDDWNTLFLKILNTTQDTQFDNKMADFLADWMFLQDPEIRRLVTVKELL